MCHEILLRSAQATLTLFSKANEVAHSQLPVNQSGDFVLRKKASAIGLPLTESRGYDLLTLFLEICKFRRDNVWVLGQDVIEVRL